MRGKLLSWVLLFVAFWFWIYAFVSADTPGENPTATVVYILSGIWTTFFTTYFAPRTPVYDLVRYFMIAVLMWMAYNVSIKVMWGLLALAVVLLPSVIVDFKGEGEARRNRFLAKYLPAAVRDHQVYSLFNSQCTKYLRKRGYRCISVAGIPTNTRINMRAHDREGNMWNFKFTRRGGDVEMTATAVSKKPPERDDLIDIYEIIEGWED